MNPIITCVALALTSVAMAREPVSEQHLRGTGAFGFPQAHAKVLCDSPELRLSAWSNDTHLYVQAIVWNDADTSAGEGDEGREFIDNSVLDIDADADQKATEDVDRNYSLNPWPNMPGLYYSVVFDESATSPLTDDSQGRGSIQMIELAPAAPGGAPRKARIDNFLIPLAELKREPGDQVRLSYWARIAPSDARLNSAGFVPPEGKPAYWSHQIPMASQHAITVGAAAFTPEGGAVAVLDASQVPEGRVEVGAQKRKAQEAAAKRKPKPTVGKLVGEAGGPIEIEAGAWMNWEAEQPPSLASLKGKVVVVEFWATWCGPCIAGIPHLNELHKAHAEEGLVILSLSDEPAKTVQAFVTRRGPDMAYTVGAESEAVLAYGVSGIPQAFVIDRAGKLVWEGHPSDEGFDKAIKKALASK